MLGTGLLQQRLHVLYAPKARPTVVMTTGVGTEGPVIGAKRDLAVTDIAVGVLRLGQLIVHEDEIVSAMIFGRTHIRQIQQVTPDTIPGSPNRDSVTLGAIGRKKLAFGSLVPPIVAAETAG